MTDQPEPPRNPVAPGPTPAMPAPTPPPGWQAPTPPTVPQAPVPVPHPAPPAAPVGAPPSAAPHPNEPYASGPHPGSADGWDRPPRPAPAPVGPRFAAWLVDQLLVGLIVAVLAAAIWLPIVGAVDWEPFECAESTSGFCERTTTGSNILIGAGVVLSIVFAVVLVWWYYVRRVSRTGATLGKSLLGLRIVDETTGRPPTATKAFVRWLVADLFSSRLLYLGYLWAFVDDRRRTWHDRLADTLVVEG